MKSKSKQDQKIKSRWKGKSPVYVFYMFFILSIMDIFDSYTTLYPPVIVSRVQQEFLSGFPQNIADSKMALILAIASIGMYFVLLNQFLSDIFGRKIFLFITLFGMGIFSLFIALSKTLSQFTIALFFMYVFFSTDMFIIYISEESPKDRRGININIIMVFGCIGSIAVMVLRSIFITDTSSNWRVLAFVGALAIPFSFLLFGLKETTKFMELKKLKESRDYVKKPLFKNFTKPFKPKYRKEFLSMLFVSFLLSLNISFIQLGELFLSNHENLHQSDVNVILLSMGGAAIIGYAFTGYLADKIGRKKISYIYSILIPLSIALIVFGVENASIALLVSCIGASLISVSYYGLGILNRLFCIEILPTDIRGVGSSIRSVISAIGITIGLLLNSWLNMMVGLGIAFLISSFLLLLAIPTLYYFVQETKGIELKVI